MGKYKSTAPRPLQTPPTGLEIVFPPQFVTVTGTVTGFSPTFTAGLFPSSLSLLSVLFCLQTNLFDLRSRKAFSPMMIT